jgi:peptide chain release factor 2
VRDDLELIDGLEERLSELETLFELGTEEGDDSVEPEVGTGIATLTADLDRLELRALFSGEHDERDAICEIHSGAGGTDAQDWAEMLLRTYLRWAESRGFDVELDEVQGGTEAGITSATFIVKGRYA